jgi:prefoldin subunit 5
MIKLTKKYLKDVWAYLWSLTTVDEKAVEVVEEVKKRAKNVKKEIKDVGEAIAEVGDQIGDIPGAIKGEARKGRKKK